MKKIMKKLFPVIAAFFFIFIVSCKTAPSPATAYRTVPYDFFGMAPYQRALVREDFDLLDELGVVWQRRTCRWGSMERQRGVWDFSDWDAYVGDSKAAGKKLLAILAYDANWIYDEPPGGRRINAENLPHFINYVEQIVTRYKGRIDAYEIWNEPNWRTWKGTREEFLNLTLAAARKVREIDPDAKILAGSFLHVPSSFIADLFKTGIMDIVDAISFHPYALGPSGTVKYIDKMEKELAKYNYKGEIWITEVGYPTGGWYPTSVKERDFPRYIIQTLAGLAIRNIRAVFWYELKDSYNRGEAPSRMDSESFFGIAYLDFTKKNGFNAWALCGQHLAGTVYRDDWPMREGLSGRTVSLCFKGQTGKNVLLLWNERGQTRVMAEMPGPATVYDISTGEGRMLARNEEILITKDPVFITWQSAENVSPKITSVR